MGEPLPNKTLSETPSERRLDSWKEIATYLGRDVTTVQRWERREGMPVHRHPHHQRSSGALGSGHVLTRNQDAERMIFLRKGAGGLQLLANGGVEFAAGSIVR